ncbi:MAG: hypothetical protein WBP42_03250 [Candidatus Zixiibacteriota bacterium]
MTSRFYATSFFLIVLAIAALSCSRKGDDELPARVGDLQVLFRISDEFGVLPDTTNIPVVLSLYTDTSHAVLVRSEAINVRNHVTMAVSFEEMEPTFFSLAITINVAGLQEACDDFRVFVQQNLVTRTELYELDVRAEEIICSH